MLNVRIIFVMNYVYPCIAVIYTVCIVVVNSISFGGVEKKNIGLTITLQQTDTINKQTNK